MASSAVAGTDACLGMKATLQPRPKLSRLFPVCKRGPACAFILQDLELQLSEQRGLTRAIALQGGGAPLCNPPPEERSRASPW